MKELKQNRATLRLMARGIIPSQGKLTPMGKAVSLRHKKPYQKKQENKAALAHDCRAVHVDI
jgi:hypothetical protein